MVQATPPISRTTENPAVTRPKLAEPPSVIERRQHEALNHPTPQSPPEAVSPPPSTDNNISPPRAVTPFKSQLRQQEVATDQSPRAKALAEALFGNTSNEQETSVAVPTLASPSTPFLSANTLSDEDLEAHVQRKADAATAALKKGNSSDAGSIPATPIRRKSTKKITTQKIGTPIPLDSPSITNPATSPLTPDHSQLARGNSSATSGTGSRFLSRIRGSLRTKGTHVVEQAETTSWSNSSPPSAGPAQTIHYNPQALHPPEIMSVPAHGSAANLASFRAPQASPGVSSLHSPPASAGPAGLKGFMARLRQSKGSVRKEEPPASQQPKISPTVTQHTVSDQSPQRAELSRAPSSIRHDYPGTPQSNSSHATPSSGDAALRNLYEAALYLGLDPNKVSDLVNESASNVNRSPWTGASQPSSSARHTPENRMLVSPSASSSDLLRQLSTKSRAEVVPTPRARVARDGSNPASTVVRRTIFFPTPSTSANTSSPAPPEARGSSLHRKISTRRSQSSTSHYSGKSVNDRAPTPPPPRGNAARRFSEDMPPLPVPSIEQSQARMTKYVQNVYGT